MIFTRASVGHSTRISGTGDYICLLSITKERKVWLRKKYLGKPAGSKGRKLQVVHGLSKCAGSSWMLGGRVRRRDLASVGGIPVHMVLLLRAQAMSASSSELRKTPAASGNSGDGGSESLVGWCSGWSQRHLFLGVDKLFPGGHLTLCRLGRWSSFPSY